VKLLQALDILNGAPDPDLPSRKIYLACGFTPLHLETFLRAHLFATTKAKVEIRSGLYGDLIGNFERFQPSEFSHLVVVIEWSDLDPRLGVRSLGGWTTDHLAEVVESADQQLQRIHTTVRKIATSIPVIISLPSLPLIPFSHYAPIQFGRYELEIRRNVLDFVLKLADLERVTTLNPSYLFNDLKASDIFDFRGELSTGFPYKVQFADVLGSCIAELLEPPVPKKGLITDLDGTFWQGILGEIGPEAVSWTLDDHSQEYGVYQQLLASLASAGVLLGVASKNDPAVVDQAFKRSDLILSKKDIYPVEANWGPKSESVRKILSDWNIAPDAVVFVDDSPMEIAEVKCALPDITCILFPSKEAQRWPAFLTELRRLFGKAQLGSADSIRLESIRSSEILRTALSSEQAADDFLKTADAHIQFRVGPEQQARAFELINKTNQFNLNGLRIDQAEWAKFLNHPKAFLVTVNYRDRFGPLGTIAVLKGLREPGILHVQSWVMSCRAFSRRIEYQCMRFLFEIAGDARIVLEYESTPKNGPLREFLSHLAGDPLLSPVRLTKEKFEASCPELYHRVDEIHELEREKANG
jgi:FkbH-like protein